MRIYIARIGSLPATGQDLNYTPGKASQWEDCPKTEKNMEEVFCGPQPLLIQTVKGNSIFAKMKTIVLENKEETGEKFYFSKKLQWE